MKIRNKNMKECFDKIRKHCKDIVIDHNKNCQGIWSFVSYEINHDGRITIHCNVNFRGEDQYEAIEIENIDIFCKPANTIYDWNIKSYKDKEKEKRREKYEELKKEFE
jgi:hypothetical protein